MTSSNLGVGQAQVLSFQIPLTYVQNGVTYPLLPQGNYVETVCLSDAYTSSGNNCGVAGYTASFSQGTSVTTTTMATTGPVPFVIDYPGQVTNLQVSPVGSNVVNCTPQNQASPYCGSGFYAYLGYWSVGTQLSVTATFSSAYYNAKVCTSSCTSITSGQAFAVTVTAPAANGVPGQAIVQAQASSTPPVTIVPQTGLGTWSPSSAQTINPSTSPTSVTFTFQPPSGYSCTGAQWVLFSPGTDQYFDSGPLTGNAVTFTYSALQNFITAQGYTWDLFSGTLTQSGLSGTGCTPVSYTVTTQASANVAEWLCSTAAAPNTNTYVCPHTQTFYVGTLFFAAIGADGYGISSVYVNGQIADPVQGATGGKPGSGWYSISLNQNYVLSASAQAITGFSGTCHLDPSTNAGMSITVVDGKTGKPIQGAAVTLDPGNGASILTGTSDQNGGVTLCNFPLNTGAGGALGLTNSAPVTITVSANGYQTASNSPTAYQGVTTLYTMKLTPNAGIGAYGTIAGGLLVLAGLGTMAYGLVAGPKKRTGK